MKNVASESLSCAVPLDWPSSYAPTTTATATDCFDPRGWFHAPTGPSCIFLSNRDADLVALVDPEDKAWSQAWLWSFSPSSGGGRIKWAGHVGPEKLYARRCESWRCPKTGYRRTWNVWLHREVLRRFAGEPPSAEHVGDHINGNSLDCRRINLRWATLSENAKNRFGTAWMQLRMPGV